MKLRSIILSGLVSCYCCAVWPFANRSTSAPVSQILYDNVRNRTIPVTLYGVFADAPARPLAIISHGYGGHAGDYSFLADALVEKGYVVASVEHDVQAGDPQMAADGDLGQLRRPVWQVGVDSIAFVIHELVRQGRADPLRKVLLIGHSNGGDIAMLFAT
jgi:alpha-beta hydrolase superfamily lysophospholipase